MNSPLFQDTFEIFILGNDITIGNAYLNVFHSRTLEIDDNYQSQVLDK